MKCGQGAAAHASELQPNSACGFRRHADRTARSGRRRSRRLQAARHHEAETHGAPRLVGEPRERLGAVVRHLQEGRECAVQVALLIGVNVDAAQPLVERLRRLLGAGRNPGRERIGSAGGDGQLRGERAELAPLQRLALGRRKARLGDAIDVDEAPRPPRRTAEKGRERGDRLDLAVGQSGARSGGVRVTG